MHKNFKLKVRAKTLADEARYLKLEKRKTERSAQRVLSYAEEYPDNVASTMKDHFTRIGKIDWERKQVRLEARAVNLARAYLKGMPYLRVENTTKSTTSEMLDLVDLIEDYVYLYSDVVQDHTTEVEEWMGFYEGSEEEDEEDDVSLYIGMMRALGLS